MNDPRASSTFRLLIEAAKSDGPNALRRAEMWSSVSRSVPTTIPPGVAKSPLNGASGGKTVSMGTIFGGAVTVGLATAVLILQPTRSLGPTSSGKAGAATASARVVLAVPSEDSRAARDEARESRSVLAANPAADVGTHPAPHADEVTAEATGNVAAPVAVAPQPPRPSTRPSAPASPAHLAYDPLAREASLLTQARAALAQGDARAALRAVRAAMAVPGRQLVPEELSVESQALRALGRSRDADTLATELRTRYPDSALAR